MFTVIFQWYCWADIRDMEPLECSYTDNSSSLGVIISWWDDGTNVGWKGKEGRVFGKQLVASIYVFGLMIVDDVDPVTINVLCCWIDFQLVTSTNDRCSFTFVFVTSKDSSSLQVAFLRPFCEVVELYHILLGTGRWVMLKIYLLSNQGSVEKELWIEEWTVLEGPIFTLKYDHSCRVTSPQ